jgi:hypothetical protein
MGFASGALGCNEILGLDAGKLRPAPEEEGCASATLPRWNPSVPRAYTPGSPDTVFDQSTNLWWVRRIREEPLTVAGAIARCDALTLDGYSDWRLPSRVELGSIVDYGKIDPAIDTTIFAPHGDGFWTSSDSNAFAGRQIYVEFTTGRVDAEGIPDEERFVRCVRSEPAGEEACSPRYEVLHGGEVVEDVVTNLEWQRAVDTSATRTFGESNALCQTLVLPNAGGGWRLPTVHELQSLVDEDANDVTIDARHFPDTPNQYFWSSTESREAGKAWVTDFYSGSAYGFDKTIRTSAGERFYARCVRTSQTPREEP